MLDNLVCAYLIGAAVIKKKMYTLICKIDAGFSLLENKKNDTSRHQIIVL